MWLNGSGYHKMNAGMNMNTNMNSNTITSSTMMTNIGMSINTKSMNMTSNYNNDDNNNKNNNHGVVNFSQHSSRVRRFSEMSSTTVVTTSTTAATTVSRHLYWFDVTKHTKLFYSLIQLFHGNEIDRPWTSKNGAKCTIATGCRSIAKKWANCRASEWSRTAAGISTGQSSRPKHQSIAVSRKNGYEHGLETLPCMAIS